ncbi:MAG: glycosyltransferase family 2 protein [Acetobacteraceae bacterium]
MLVCAPGEADIAGLTDDVAAEILFAPAGLPRQRNAVLDRVGDCDAILFLDDDFLMSPDYVAETVSAFTSHPDIVVTTGTTIADGVKGPGIDVETARAMIAAASRRAADTGLDSAAHGYGCNMALRLGPVRAHAIRFDERLPLYGWSEDVDYTHRLGQFGRIVKLRGANGVHLGVKQGRSRGDRLGYSQVANPIYLFRKGSYSFGRAARSVGRNLAANLARSLQPEAYIDRRGPPSAATASPCWICCAAGSHRNACWIFEPWLMEATAL